MYNNGDEEEILLAVLYQRQKLYAKEGQYDTIGNSNPIAIPPPQPTPPSTTKKSNTKRPRPPSTKKKPPPPTKKKSPTSTKKKKIKPTTKKKKKKKNNNKESLPTPKLHNADEETVVTHGNYTPK